MLLVDDILTTGGSLLAMLPAVEAAGGEIVGCLVMADRSGGTAVLASPTTGRRYPVQGLWQLEIPTFEPGPATCPRCADGTPLYAPGSTGTGRRPDVAASQDRAAARRTTGSSAPSASSASAVASESCRPWVYLLAGSMQSPAGACQPAPDTYASPGAPSGDEKSVPAGRLGLVERGVGLGHELLG